jgi:hypothetical protein
MTATNFNPDARALILAPAKDAVANVETTGDGALIDARLLKSPKGYAVPVANTSADVSKPVTLKIRGAGKIKQITSAAKGELKVAGDSVTYETGFGDILRIDSE